MDTIPQFLCFRFKGLKRPDEILAASEKTGWSFRKWQNWKQVHLNSSDTMLLKNAGDSLVDNGRFSLPDFGRLSELLLNVHRWRKDKVHMSMPPDPLPAWSEMDELLKVFAASPAAMAVKMQRDIGGVEGVVKDRLLDVFHWHLLTEFFQRLKHPDLEAVTFVKPWDLKNLERGTVESIQKLYKSVGLSVPAFSTDPWSRKLVARCYQDLGFSQPTYDLEIPWETAPTTPAVTHPIISYGSLGPVELFRISHRESSLLLCINKDHALMKAIDRLSSKAVLELFLAAYAESIAALPNKQDDLEHVSTLLGMKTKYLLAKRT